MDTRGKILARKSDSEDEEPFAYERQRQLVVGMCQLSCAQLVKCVLIMKTCEPSYTDFSQQELDIDFNTLKPSTLRQLESFVGSCITQKAQATYDENISGKSEDEQIAEEQKELEKRLQPVSGQLGSAKKHAREDESRSIDGAGGPAHISASTSSSSDRL